MSSFTQTRAGSREGSLTFEDFLVLIPDGQKADLLEGAIYVASPDNLNANDLNGWLHAVLDAYVRERKAGRVYVSRVAFRVGAKRGPEPDIAFVSADRLTIQQRGYVDGPPDWAIEIVSPDSVDRDYVLKRKIYEQAGVCEYWILDPDPRQATFLRLRAGSYQEVQPENHRIESEVVRGFWLDDRWLFDAQRPTPLAVLKQLLGEDKG